LLEKSHNCKTEQKAHANNFLQQKISRRFVRPSALGAIETWNIFEKVVFNQEKRGIWQCFAHSENMVALWLYKCESSITKP
jgi:hypothetical protein